MISSLQRLIVSRQRHLINLMYSSSSEKSGGIPFCSSSHGLSHTRRFSTCSLFFLLGRFLFGGPISLPFLNKTRHWSVVNVRWRYNNFIALTVRMVLSVCRVLPLSGSLSILGRYLGFLLALHLIKSLHSTEKLLFDCKTRQQNQVLSNMTCKSQLLQ